MALQLRTLLSQASRQYRAICMGYYTPVRRNHQLPKEAHHDEEAPYGFVFNEEGDLKRSKDTQGMNRIGFVRLPDDLERALQLFYKRQPRKRLTQDGQQIHRHLLNRGRPVHNTWKKYKEEQRAKSARRVEVKNFSVDEAAKEGLLDNDIENLESASEKDYEEEEEGFEDDKLDKKVAKKPQLTQYSMIRYGSRESAAYTASQLPAVYGATLRAFNEIKRLAPDYQPRTMLDFGSGTGMSVWAGNSTWGNSIKEYQCVDVSDHMNDIAEFLLRGGSSKIEDPLVIPGVYFKKFLPLSNRIMYDVVVAAYSLTEMPFRQQRLQAIKSLWRKTNHFLVLVEPGNNEGFDTNLLARRYISEDLQNQTDDIEDFEEFEYDDDFRFGSDFGDLEEDLRGHIFAPCPHEMVCARTFVETRDHPCNFEQKVQLSFAQRNTHLKRYGYYNERFSYIIFKKGEKSEDEMNWTRVLQPIKKRKKHVICELCCSNGNIEKHILTKKKDPVIYKAARHCLHWGDMMPLDEAKRPMNIRKPIPPK